MKVFRFERVGGSEHWWPLRSTFDAILFEGSSALEGPSIDDQIGQGIEIAHRAGIKYLGPLDAQFFGLAVDVLRTGALLVDAGGFFEMPPAPF
jgi:hypothetical protein